MSTRTTASAEPVRIGMRRSPEEYERFAVAHPDVPWELYQGRLREKPGMSVSHNRVTVRLGGQLLRQLDERVSEVRISLTRLRRHETTYYIPDVAVVPVEQIAAIEDRPGVLEAFADPLPLVVEVWSPSTGQYDVEDKLPEYQRRGDLEIWRIHPYERTLTVWRRQADGAYRMTVVTGGVIEPGALPGVRIDVDALVR